MQPRPFALLATSALLVLPACSEQGATGSDTGDAEETAGDLLAPDSPPEGETDSAPLEDLGEDADTAADPCVGVTCDGAGRCVEDMAGPLCLCDEGYASDGLTRCVPVDPCREALCAEPHRGVCVPDADATPGYRCDCERGFTLDGEACLVDVCDAERATTGVTIFDMTPLPETADPVAQGFDPLLKGDTIRVVTEFTHETAPRPIRLLLVIDNLVLDESTARLNGEPVAIRPLPFNRYEVDLPLGMTEGRLAFDGTIPESGPGLLAIDARVTTASGCPIIGSASGVRVQLTGSPNPKHALCNDLGDLRSLQISPIVQDKNTGVYRERNGSRPALGAGLWIVTEMTLCIRRPEGVTVSFSGSADGTRPWTVDNYILVEVFDGDPTRPGTQLTSAWTTTSWGTGVRLTLSGNIQTAMLNHASLPGEITGSQTPAPFSYPPGVVQLSRFLPEGQSTWIRVTALDSGSVGHLSPLFIHSNLPGESVPECRSHRDCVRGDSTNGSSSQLRAGCLAGRCEVVTCSEEAPCPLGQRCMQGFCDESCDDDASCAEGQVCASWFGVGGRCVDLEAGGCRDARDCPEKEICNLGRCEAGCYTPRENRPDYSRNYATSNCRLFDGACPRCGEASDRCFSSFCRDCEIDPHCPEGQACRDFRCVTAERGE